MSSTRPAISTQRRNTIIGAHQTCSASSMAQLYESGDVIGTGSFGIIRKVKRKQDGMILARKELNYGRMDERDLRQLTEEVNILEQLGSNDNIVRYYERFVDKPNNMLYILMEYCEGGDLSGVIQRCRKTGTFLSEDAVWAYLAQVTLALYDCHAEVDASGSRKPVILHRDIKPENVFLDKENNLKLGDFGLSKAMQQASMTNTYVGTPYYMSPELINGQPYDIKSDVWALGCLIYELCVGHPPFHEARTQPELAVLIREGKIPDLPKPYTPHLGQVVKAMLKQNPKHRPNTFQLKALDSVKLQIRAIELRKATKELRLRDHQIALRETDLLTREASVLSRERAVLMRENAIRAGAEKLREERGAWAKEREDRENVGIATARDTDEESGRIRAGGRPSLVPRRPLEERKSSSKICFPRLASNLSLMSLDDTPTKPSPSLAFLSSPSTPTTTTIPTSLRKRLASKSMHDLKAAAANVIGNGDRSASRLSRMESMGSLSTRASAQELLNNLTGGSSDNNSPVLTTAAGVGGNLLEPHFGRRSESSSAPSNINTSTMTRGLGASNTRISPVFRNSSATTLINRPSAPPRTSTAPASTGLSTPSVSSSSTASSSSSGSSSSAIPPSIPSRSHTAPPPPTPHQYTYTDDNIPSPFLKKTDSIRYTSFSAASSAAAAAKEQREFAGAGGKSPSPVLGSRASSSSISRLIPGGGGGGGRISLANRLLSSRAINNIGAEESTVRVSSRRGSGVGLAGRPARVGLP